MAELGGRGRSGAEGAQRTTSAGKSGSVNARPPLRRCSTTGLCCWTAERRLYCVCLADLTGFRAPPHRLVHRAAQTNRSYAQWCSSTRLEGRVKSITCINVFVGIPKGITVLPSRLPFRGMAMREPRPPPITLWGRRNGGFLKEPVHWCRKEWTLWADGGRPFLTIGSVDTQDTASGRGRNVRKTFCAVIQPR